MGESTDGQRPRRLVTVGGIAINLTPGPAPAARPGGERLEIAIEPVPPAHDTRRTARPELSGRNQLLLLVCGVLVFGVLLGVALDRLFRRARA